MIDPKNITNYNLTTNQLQEHLLFWVFAAGHNAASTAKGLNKFLTSIKGGRPFMAVRRVVKEMGWEGIERALGNSGLGCWRKKVRTIQELVEDKLNLRTCSVADLEQIYCIGAKTARCFVLHSRKGIDNIACLDTHVLKYMRDEGVPVPKSTPTKRRYLELEQEFLKLAKKSDKTLAEFDLWIWNKYAKSA